ncbi:hypothetical protein M378DRAFT_19291 [Amanita muscaria Koide BX008]|uniref:Uncharacterized protein n=1 Tax=Amanita muscaria (strain Koide BX008) TaxID=946122 RepID=A0A0C2WBT1_AMAMK|nr:hypothetical protein M378DRAFT_19291 [Amanita muscaria Koide BX008]
MARVSTREKNPSARLTAADNVELPTLPTHRATIAAAAARAKAKNIQDTNDDTSQGPRQPAADAGLITPLTQAPVTPDASVLGLHINNVEEIDERAKNDERAQKRSKKSDGELSLSAVSKRILYERNVGDASETDANGMYTDTHVMEISDDESNKKKTKNKTSEATIDMEEFFPDLTPPDRSKGEKKGKRQCKTCL